MLESAIPDPEKIKAETPKTPKAGKTSLDTAKLKSQIESARNSAEASANKVGQKATEVETGLRKYLRYDEPKPVEEESLAATPLYAAGNVLDGTLLNLARREVDIIGSYVSVFKSSVDATLGTLIHPTTIVTSPIETFVKKPARVLTSMGILGKNTAMAIPRAAKDFANRTIDRPVQQVSTKLEKIPGMGLVTKPAKFVTGATNKVVSGATNVLEKVTSPIDYLHEKVKKKK